MKKVLTLAIVALFAVSASAQEGSMYLGASGIGFWDEVGTGFSYDKNSIGDKTTAFGIAPEFGYFFADNMAVGIIAGFNYSKTDFEAGGEGKEMYLRINPYLRYFLLQQGNFGLYLQGGVNYVRENESKTNTIGVGIIPGVSYAISPKFTATASFGNLGYEYEKVDDADASSKFGLNLNSQSLIFSLSYNF